MRKFVVALGVVALVVVAAVVYLVVTTPKSAPLLAFPLTAEQQRFIARVPGGADAFAYVPAAAVVHAKLLANPVTAEPLLNWSAQQPLPRSWMLGGADLLVWRTGKTTSYAVRFDPVRAMLVRIWTIIAGPHDARWDGNVLLIADDGARTPPQPLDVALTNELPAGDALVVQRKSARGAFPPIGRPAFSSVRIAREEILVVSRARTDEPALPEPLRVAFPKGALLSVAFGEPPRLLGEFTRLLGSDIRELVGSGGMIALYDIDAGLLLPRPKGVIAVRANEQNRAVVESYRKTIEIVGEAGEVRDQLLVSFDRRSLGLYMKDELVPASLPATTWSGRIDPSRLTPILRRLGDDPGLRLAAPKIHRAARDLRSWVAALEQADSVEAAETVSDGAAELRVRITSK